MNLIQRYTKWLHTRWPAGVVEKLPQVDSDYQSSVKGIYIVGDLTGIPLLKFSADSGAKAVRHILSAGLNNNRRETDCDIVIIGAGVAGMSAALEAKKNGLNYTVLEATEPFSTIVNFPKAKPIYTYPTEMIPEGDLQFRAEVKEDLVDELQAQTLGQGIQPLSVRAERIERKSGYFEVHADSAVLKTQRIIIAIGRSGNFRKLNVPGEEKNKVINRLHDPKDYTNQNVLIVGGGDSALETAIAIAQCGGNVTLSYRGQEFSRPKADNVDRLKQLLKDPRADVAVETPVSERVTTCAGGFLGDSRRAGQIHLMLGSTLKEISDDYVILIDSNKQEVKIPNDTVFAMIGREAPLDFFRRNGIRISGEMGAKQWIMLIAFVLFCAFVYHWKAGGSLTQAFSENNWFPFGVSTYLNSITELAAQPASLIGTMNITLSEPGFYYSLVYTLLVVIFGIQRIKRRKTPYIRVQTITLSAIQLFPLFLLPYFILPYLGHNGLFDSGWLKTVADALFPEAGYGHGREYWRAFGFILAWPLFIWNVFTWQPMWTWLVISIIQTFVIIPIIIYYWGKGAYCGWICSCGALAETLGDNHRHKMPHGWRWNRLNMIGQGILAVALILLLSRLFGWMFADLTIGQQINTFYEGLLYNWTILGIPVNYKYIIDLFLAGIIGYGLYFWFSGRVWCRFACPLAALMHIYARFSRFRIFAEKKKCISCNICTSVCHQGIDVMNFANKGLAMEDPECVRCSACVQSCPTGVLQFGQIDRRNGQSQFYDRLQASPVLMSEKNDR